MPLIATRGAASAQGFGEFAQSAAPVYIEDVFSTYLYTGNGSTQTITNGIDLAGKGGLVWLKNRTGGSGPHNWYTTAIGSASYLDSSQTSGLATYQEALSTYNSDGFSLSSGAAGGNENTFTYASWTFRKQPKFFDVVTWTGDGTGDRAISHNLGSAPGFIVTKQISAASDWYAYHRSLGNSYYISLNQTSASATSVNLNWNVTSTTFTADSFLSLNDSGVTYVAYLFAHDAGGFGLTGTDNVISCGSYVRSNGKVTLGFEPQWIMIKSSSGVSSWRIVDNMRGLTASGTDAYLFANLTNAEASGSNILSIDSTGFTDLSSASSETIIYIAIRRGPMKVPTSGTSVLGLNARNGNGSNTTVTGGAGVTDFSIIKNRGAATNWVFASRLTANRYLSSNLTAAEVSASTAIFQPNPWDVMDGVKVGTGSSLTNQTENTYINYLFDRAPSFMDVVCYTGNGVSGRNITHNLTVSPELVIIKSRNRIDDWVVRSSAFPTHGVNGIAYLNSTGAATNAGYSYVPTTTTFQVDSNNNQNGSSYTYVAYLFATCAGVSKVGSYTGNDTTQTINCGFTTGARFVLVKRTDNTANWATSDTARGMVSGTNPALRVNLTNAESAADFFVTTSVGFQIVSSDPTVNADGGTYIFLAIA
jgi:hypothetical protein